jgi:hypothetical protein
MEYGGEWTGFIWLKMITDADFGGGGMAMHLVVS